MDSTIASINDTIASINGSGMITCAAGARARPASPAAPSPALRSSTPPAEEKRRAGKRVRKAGDAKGQEEEEEREKPSGAHALAARGSSRARADLGGLEALLNEVCDARGEHVALLHQNLNKTKCETNSAACKSGVEMQIGNVGVGDVNGSSV
eukprot:2263161-Rhodomonas_salina.1